MDSLVARYSRPATLQRETFEEDQQDDFDNDMGSGLSLKFAMPPVAQVGSNISNMPTPHLPTD